VPQPTAPSRTQIRVLIFTHWVPGPFPVGLIGPSVRLTTHFYVVTRF
jgi:hypothetical protein